jgi:hypothetical protein
MPTNPDPYSRSLWRFADEFPDIYADDACYALWSRLRDLADMAWPSAGTLPYGAKRKALQRLIDAGLVTMADTMHYRIRGMDKHRTGRQDAAKAAADARWNRSARNADALQEQSKRTADAMHIPSRAKPSQAEPSQGAPASDADPIWTYNQLTARTPSKGALDWLDRLGRDYGDDAVCRAMAVEWTADPDLRTMLGRVEAGLASASRKADQAAEAKRKRSAIEEARELEQRLAQVSPEERARAETVKAQIAGLVKGMPS